MLGNCTKQLQMAYILVSEEVAEAAMVRVVAVVPLVPVVPEVHPIGIRVLIPILRVPGLPVMVLLRREDHVAEVLVVVLRNQVVILVDQLVPMVMVAVQEVEVELEEELVKVVQED